MDAGETSGQLGLSFQPFAQGRRVWTPRELMSAVRTAVEREYGDVWVEGEISNFRPAESGHLYFTLKDEGAQLRVVLFRTQARLLRFRPENGMHALARGRVTVYESRGELQLSAEYLEPKGAGALQVAFEQLKAKLQAEGLFEEARKKALPAYPQRIGVVTSPRGAAIQDIINILQRRHAGVSLLIYPAQVQGEAAATETAAGIKFFNRARSVDVIVVARGGGSLEDLAAYNHEGLARVIAASEIPLSSAIGHETDFTIADFVADLRAPTPSAAAELVVRSREEILDQVAAQRHKLVQFVRYRLAMQRSRLSQRGVDRAHSLFHRAVGRRLQRIDELHYRLRERMRAALETRARATQALTARLRYYDPRPRLGRDRSRHEAMRADLLQSMRLQLSRRRGRLESLQAKLSQLSPLTILNRGYAIVTAASGHILMDAE